MGLDKKFFYIFPTLYTCAIYSCWRFCVTMYLGGPFAWGKVSYWVGCQCLLSFLSGQCYSLHRVSLSPRNFSGLTIPVFDELQLVWVSLFTKLRWWVGLSLSPELPLWVGLSLSPELPHQVRLSLSPELPRWVWLSLSSVLSRWLGLSLSPKLPWQVGLSLFPVTLVRWVIPISQVTSVG